MLSIQKILVATDFSDTSKVAVRYATELATAFQAQLEVLHVVEEPLGYIASTHGYIPEVDAFRETLNKAAREQLHGVFTAAEMELWKPRLSLRAGTPYAEIVRHAKDHAVDLIVLGTHGRGLLTHALLGSVAEKVTRYAHCPVLTVRDPQQNAD